MTTKINKLFENEGLNIDVACEMNIFIGALLWLLFYCSHSKWHVSTCFSGAYFKLGYNLNWLSDAVTQKQTEDLMLMFRAVHSVGKQADFQMRNGFQKVKMSSSYVK